jgi:hypothetical protein
LNLLHPISKLIEQRAKLLEKYGLDRFQVDQRDDGAKALHADLAELCKAVLEAQDTLIEAGIDWRDRSRPPPDPEVDAEGA